MALVLAAIGVFVVLPRFTPEVAIPPTSTPAAPGPQSQPAEVDYQALAQEMEKAEQARGSYEALFESYGKQGAAEWAAEPFAVARDKGEAARRQFARREFAAAQQTYNEGLDSLQRVADIAKQNAEAAKQALAREQARKAAEQARVAADNFATAVAEGLRLLVASRLGEARAAFNRAAKIRPGTQEVQSGLAQVAQAEQRQQIAAARKRAEAAEENERWSDALAQYEAALKLDPALAFALSGRDRVQPRLQLATELDRLIAQPERLWSAAVREQARGLLAEARKVGTPGPVLRQQTEKLQAQLGQAEVPVKVALESDNATEVVISRVGQLGSFGRRELELLPGTYTVRGARPGYRDVRRELTVRPGETPAILIVRCEERI